MSLIPLYLSKKNFNIDNDIEIDVDIDKYINICIDKYHNICIDNIIDIDIDTENFNTDASTVNSVHACLFSCSEHAVSFVGYGCLISSGLS